MAKASPARRSKRETLATIAKRLATHPCGECAVCCTVQGVPELGKPEGLPCSRLRAPEPGQGACGVYPGRPGTCAGYQCLWRLGLLGEGLTGRPDKLGVVFDVHNTHASGVQLVTAREVRTGALETQMARLHELAAQGHVLYLIDMVSGVERTRMMGPEEKIRALQEAARRKLPLVSQ